VNIETSSDPSAYRQDATAEPKRDKRDDFTRTLFTWLNQVNTDSGISATAFRLTFAISQFINRGTLEAWPGQDTLAGIIGVSERTVRNALAELVARGHLEVTPGHGPKNPNRYRWRIKNGNESGAEKRKQASSFKDGNEETGFLFSEPDEEISDTKRGRKLPHKRGSQLPTNHLIEPSDEPSEGVAPQRSNGNRSRGRRRPSTAWPDGFHLDDDLADHAVQKAGWDHGRAFAEFERFENYHRSKGSVFANWRSAWRTWILNGIKFDRERAANQGPIIDERGNPVAAPPPHQRPPPWRGRQSNLQRAMEGGDE
jgi:hypothetical protein